MPEMNLSPSAVAVNTSRRDRHAATRQLIKSLVPGLTSFSDLRPLLDLLGRSVDPENGIEWFGVPAGTVLFREGDVGDDAFLVISGRLGVFLGLEPIPPPIARIGPGELVGEMALISEEPRSATVAALRDSEILRLPKSVLEILVKSNPDIDRLLLRLLTSRLRHTSHVRRLKERVDTLAIVPLSKPIADAKFIEGFTNSLTGLFEHVQIVRDADAESEDEFADRVDRLGAIVFIGDLERPAWTRHCIRQADHVIFVAPAGAHLSSCEPDLIRFTRDLRRSADIVIVNPLEPASNGFGGTAWLGEFRSEQILHARSGLASDYARIARLTCGRGIGLVFSGGGARAFSHVGVVEAFADAGIPIDLVGGTSMGSLIASLVALELSPSAIAERLHAAFVETNPLSDYTFPLVSLARGRKMNRLLKENFGEVSIENLWKTFFCVSANLSTGDTKVHQCGLLWHALRASTAIPGIYPPWIEDDQVLVDGGIVNNFPTSVMRSRQRGIVIGVDVAPEAQFKAFANELEEKSVLWLLLHGRRKVPSIFRILTRSALINGEAQVAASRAAADLVIRPEVGSISMLSFKAFETAIEAGRMAGAAAVTHVRQLVQGSIRPATTNMPTASNADARG